MSKKNKVSVVRMPRYTITVDRSQPETVVIYAKTPPPADKNQMKLF